jgi:hypothetical protein
MCFFAPIRPTRVAPRRFPRCTASRLCRIASRSRTHARVVSNPRVLPCSPPSCRATRARTRGHREARREREPVRPASRYVSSFSLTSTSIVERTKTEYACVCASSSVQRWRKPWRILSSRTSIPTPNRVSSEKRWCEPHLPVVYVITARGKTSVFFCFYPCLV